MTEVDEFKNMLNAILLAFVCVHHRKLKYSQTRKLVCVAHLEVVKSI